MALQDTQAPASGVWGAIKGALNLFSDVNKADGVSENQNPQPIDEYESSYSELEITELVEQWKRSYSAYYGDVEPGQTLSFEYWIGKQRSEEAEQVMGNSPLVDNKIFESVETFIPIATRANPDPLVECDPGDMGQKIARDIKQALIHEADRQKFRKILKKILRNWIIYRIGIAKVSYNTVLEQIETTVINPKRMVFDKDGHWDEAGYFTGQYIGEKKQSSADKLIEMFPKKKAQILQKCQDKLGTKLEYMEWWYRRTDVFYTMDEIVLGKYKNPHWNYDVKPKLPTEPSDTNMDEPQLEGQPGINHFLEPQYPYVGLSIFSTGLQPHDETSLILQNIGIQDMINRRWRQIDRNVEGMNNGIVVNDEFTLEQASQAASALKRGTAIRVPGKNVDGAIKRIPAPAIPADVYESLRDGRQELSNIFGTSGSTPQGVNSQDTVRGKILVNQLDSSRIGGGITEYLEQVADTLYNCWIQLMFVHYTDDHYIIAAGAKDGAELIALKNSNFAMLKALDVTVKEGSLIPKDPLTQRNEAIDLWSANALDPITFYTRLDFADPNDMAKKLILWQMVQKGALPPQAYIPDFQVPPQALPQAGVGGPAVNPIDNSAPTAPTPPLSPSAVQSQEHQLIGSVPLQ